MDDGQLSSLWRKLAILAVSTFAGVAGDDFSTAGGVRICDNGDIGYNTIDELNSAMQAEFNNVDPNDPPREQPYVFVLCPNRVYDVSAEPFVPLLNNTVVSCGMNGIPDGPDGMCNFFGGSESVRMDTDGFFLTLMGLTFTNFQDVSITGNADSSSTLNLIRSNFEVSSCAEDEQIALTSFYRIFLPVPPSFNKIPAEMNLSMSL